jgi:hypothetical protein
MPDDYDWPFGRRSCAICCVFCLVWTANGVFFPRQAETMAKVETNARKIIGRLKADGWIDIGGGRHDRFIREDRVARSIAKAARWL